MKNIGMKIMNDYRNIDCVIKNNHHALRSSDTGDCYGPTGLRWFMSQFADEYFIYGSYLGPHNPMLKDNDGYSYAFPPCDLHDYFAFQHDIDYDKVGAVGTYDALFNKKTLEADLSLAIKMDAFPITKYSLWGWPTSRLFYYLAYGKFIGSLIDL